MKKTGIALFSALILLISNGASAALITDYLVWGQGAASTSTTNKDGVFIGPGSVISGTVGSRGDIQTNGVVTISNVYTGSQTIFSADTTVTGTTLINQSVFPALPAPKSFTSGGANLGGAYNNGSVGSLVSPLSPNSYGTLSGGGGWDLYLQSGTYRFDSVHFGNSTNIFLNLSGGPINIFVTGELFFGSGADVHLTNGGNAGMIYWETHLANDLNAFRAQGGSDWLGTVYAPYGGIHFGSGSGPTTFQGYFWSGWDGGTDGRAIYIEHGVTGTSPIPIPPAVWLLGSGLLGLVAMRRRFKK